MSELKKRAADIIAEGEQKKFRFDEESDDYENEIVVDGIQAEIEFDKKYLRNTISQHEYEVSETRYTNMYNKHILKGYNQKLAIFCGKTSQKMHIIKFTSHYDKLIRLTEYYNYVTNHLKDLLEETNIKHRRKAIKMIIEEIQVINYIKDMINNRKNNCKCYNYDKSNKLLDSAKFILEVSLNNPIRSCIYCNGLQQEYYRLKLEKALDNANAENERVLNILKESIIN